MKPIRKCRYCAKILVRNQKYYCSYSHKSAYFSAERRLKIQNMSPDEFIAQQLKYGNIRPHSLRREVTFYRRQLEGLRKKIDTILRMGEYGGGSHGKGK